MRSRPALLNQAAPSPRPNAPPLTLASGAGSCIQPRRRRPRQGSRPPCCGGRIAPVSRTATPIGASPCPIRARNCLPVGGLTSSRTIFGSFTRLSRAGFGSQLAREGEPPKRLPLISCEWTGRSRLTSLYVSQAPRTFGSRQPVSNVPAIGSVMALVVSVIDTLVYTT